MADPSMVDSSLPRFHRFDSSSSSSKRNRTKKEESNQENSTSASSSSGGGSSYIIRSSDLKRFLQHVREENENLSQQLSSSQGKTTTTTPREESTTSTGTVSSSPSSFAAMHQRNPPGKNRQQHSNAPGGPPEAYENGGSSLNTMDLQKEIEDLQKRYFKQKPSGSRVSTSTNAAGGHESSPPEPKPRLEVTDTTTTTRAAALTADSEGAEQRSLYSMSPVQHCKQASSDGSSNSPVEIQNPHSIVNQEVPAGELSTIMEQDNESSIISETSGAKGDSGEIRQSLQRKRSGEGGIQNRSRASRSPIQHRNTNGKQNRKQTSGPRPPTDGKGNRSSVPCKIPIHRQRTANQRASDAQESKHMMNKVIKNPAELLEDSDSDEEYDNDDQLTDLPATNTFVMESNDASTTSASVALDGSHHFVPPHDINLRKTVWKSNQKQNSKEETLGGTSSSMDWLGGDASLEESIVGQSEFVMPPQDSEFAS
eukprot:gb/GECG01011907.1/.p1 GENE.gb/GECG01011907.1/~~gb/GECG01011907.1/.p1  ORF type:complete len:482 (+),score=94.02 gb/GECG01011907.1/:1-1446(+)